MTKCGYCNMLMSKGDGLVATSIVLAVSTIVSVSLQLERQIKTAGRLNVSKCEYLQQQRSVTRLQLTSIA